MPDSAKHIVVSGDLLTDWVIERHEGSGQRRGTGVKWQTREQSLRATEIKGGTCLLAALIEKLIVKGFEKPATHSGIERLPFGENERLSHYYVTLGKFPLDEEEAKKEGSAVKHTRWRVDEKLGITKWGQKCPDGHAGCKVEPDHADASIVVLVDSGLGYNKVSEHWPSAIAGDGNKPWVLLKLGGERILYNLREELWGKLAPHKDKLIVVTTADDLRRNTGVKISQGVSWERIAGDCTTVLAGIPALTACRYVVVSFGPEGALLFDRDAAAPGKDDEAASSRMSKYTLLFDPARTERSADFWGHGHMWGYTSTLTASIAHMFMSEFNEIQESNESRRQVENGIKSSLVAMHKLYECGFGTVPEVSAERRGQVAVAAEPGHEAEADSAANQWIDREGLAFPIKPVTDIIKNHLQKEGWIRGNPAEPVRVAIDPSEPFHLWSILSDMHKNHLHQLARNIVLQGVDEALSDVPRAKYGSLTTVDRQEIESFESVRALVMDYAEKGGTRALPQPKEKVPEPLSIAVFGAPGSGKSTAVREVIHSLKMPATEFAFNEFNLSQFRDTKDMEDSLHLVRDDRLKGKIPLVLWDEFDTYFERELGWLRYFLSPMQDGTFQQGQALHPIGRSIFVFAGGISKSLHDFQRQGHFIEAKGPDFVSRVRGTMELKGIDKIPGDDLYVIRRAVLLRSILEKETSLFDHPAPTFVTDDAKGVEVIDPGVLNAFLEISKFSHGVRSMKAIVTTSSLSGEYYFGRSNLPAETQLNLHVEAEDFYDKMRSGPDS
ncbi:ATP-binding protein [Streptomyces sp. ISL-87]|uniref:hypothetical protein n=1 Tax=Streptomyces sp. ISL-87 TaxID=2819188 RepID=UPI001BE628C5|nr:hypothetical protein [Streptomyces sp. ISL-87]MBT2611417.1 ATP-binding protein [Streptomyces sp. ISL-87]